MYHQRGLLDDGGQRQLREDTLEQRVQALGGRAVLGLQLAPEAVELCARGGLCMRVRVRKMVRVRAAHTLTVTQV